MLCAALLRSFSGQHSEKMKGSARGNWDLREGQQPFRPNPNGVRDRTTTLRRLLIGEDRSWSFSQFVSEVATLHQSNVKSKTMAHFQSSTSAQISNEETDVLSPLIGKQSDEKEDNVDVEMTYDSSDGEE